MTERRQPMDRQKKQAATGPSADKPFTVSLSGRNGTKKVTVLPYKEWAYDWREALAADDFGTFASAILDDENLAKWRDVRPSTEQVGAFVSAWGDETGEDLGESQAS